MPTFTRVVPIGQLAITRRELEQAGATNIHWTPAGDGYVEVTATLPGDSLRERATRVVRRWIDP